MLLNNHVKQSPIVGVAGLGGGIASYVFLSAGGAYEIARSLRFKKGTSGSGGPTDGDGAANTFCERITSLGNRKTWTWSAWVKPSNFTGDQGLFGNTNSNVTFVRFKSGQMDFIVNGATHRRTTAYYRDPSAWYHFVWAVDTTQADPADRSHFYVNGVEVTDWSINNDLTLDSTTGINQNSVYHLIGCTDRVPNDLFSGYMADVWLIDGTQLDATAFGSFDNTTGVWNPKLYTGIKSGVNTFHLPFTDQTSATTLGYDDSGNDNNWDLRGLHPDSSNFSVAFDGNSSDNLSWSGSSVGSNVYTFECWFYTTTDQSTQTILGTTVSGGFNVRINSGNTGIAIDAYNSSSVTYTVPYITTHTWHHLAVSRKGTDATTVWIDGTRSSSGTQTDSRDFSATNRIGTIETLWFYGYLSNVRFVIGSVVHDPDSSTITIPDFPLTAITNTQLLTCQSSTFIDNSSNGYTITRNGDAELSPFNPEFSDSLFDSPSNDSDEGTGIGAEIIGSYPTFNPLAKNANTTLRDGNLEAGSTVVYTTLTTTAFPSTGKFYAEFTIQGTDSGYPFVGIGGFNDTGINNNANPNTGAFYAQGGYITGSVSVAGLPSLRNGDVVGVAYDASNGKTWFRVNEDAWLNSGNPAAGTNELCTLGTNSSGLAWAVSTYRYAHVRFNSGQRDFVNDAPTGFKALNTSALPTSAIEKGSDYVGITTGNFDTTKTWVTGFQPDLIWFKSRGNTDGHMVQDSVRGVGSTGKYFFIVGSGAEGTFPVGGRHGVTTFNSDGWTQESYGPISNTQMVAWTWKAGGAPTADNVATTGAMTANSVSVDGVLQSAYYPSGSGISYPTRMSVGTTQGFSIVTWSPGASAKKLPHGLGKTPKFIITKDRDNANIWIIYHASTGTQKYYRFDDQGAYTNSGAFSTAPDADLFDPGTSITTGNGYGNQIAYLWAEIPGFSKFGTYESSSDGAFVELGFRPALVIIKSEDTIAGGVNWTIQDNQRSPHNYTYLNLLANQNVADNGNSAYALLDFLSNGFKVRNTFQDYNYTGATTTYVYAAWAENPFSIARAR